MRRTAAITLVLLGGGLVASSVAIPWLRRCTDPVTGVAITCPGTRSHGFGGFIGRGLSGFSSMGLVGASTTTSPTSRSATTVSRGGFGSAGASAARGS